MNEKTQITAEVFDVKFHYAKSKIIFEREIHDYHEFLYYLDGNTTFRTETYSKKLKNHTLIFIPKGKYHLFVPDEPEKFTRLKISFYDGIIKDNLPESFFNSVKLIDKLDVITCSLLDNVVNVLKSGDVQQNDLYVYGAFLAVLASFSGGKQSSFGKNYSPVVLSCIEYIENNISGDLTIGNIGRELNFSPSTISHMFKKETGIPVHAYIAQKRLVLAKTLLNAGEKPTEIYAQCGYKDYSSFYKAYVKAFDISPNK